MRELFFDTETTGMLLYDKPLDHPGQPTLVELAACLRDNGAYVTTISKIVVPTKAQDPGAVAVHHIETKYALEMGYPLEQVLDDFAHLVALADVVIAHNYEFDRAVIEACCHATGRRNILADAKNYCTKEASTPVCKIPSANPMRGKYKWPSLSEAHRFFTGEPHTGAHRALADVRALIRVYDGIKKREESDNGEG